MFFIGIGGVYIFLLVSQLIGIIAAQKLDLQTITHKVIHITQSHAFIKR